jgi:aldose 1-epimerase
VTVSAPPRISRRLFGRARDGRPVTCFTLEAGDGSAVEVLDLGAAVRAVRVPDAEGCLADVALGYDDVAAYERDPFYVGSVVGRVAGRIGGASFELDGTRHRLTANDGANHLHGGARGFGRALWNARTFEDGEAVGVALELTSPDGDEGYPGTLHVLVTYTWSAAHVLAVEYRAACDRATPVNLTQHGYYNLAGAGSGDVLDHELTVHARGFTPLDETLLPTGEIAPVAGTPLDFRAPHPIGARIAADHAQLRIGGGYDHNYVLDGEDGALKPAARLADPASGRALEVWTTEPGMQLYTGNFLDGSLPGKGGARYGPRAGVCLETQHFPDAPNRPAFPSVVLRPGASFGSRTELRFSARPAAGRGDG